jgi:hypothetical protein
MPPSQVQSAKPTIVRFPAPVGEGLKSALLKQLVRNYCRQAKVREGCCQSISFGADFQAIGLADV